MNINDLIILVSKNKRKKERVKKLQKFTIVIGVLTAVSAIAGVLITPELRKKIKKDLNKMEDETLDGIKNTVSKKKKKLKVFMKNTAQEASNDIQDVQRNAEDVKKDIKEGYQEMTQSIHETGENISDDLKMKKRNKFGR